MKKKISFTVFLLLILLPIFVAAQTTAFTYQGKLTDNGNLANSSYDLQFKLFDTATVGTGTQQGSTVTVSNVTVTSGIFTVQLDFGVCGSCFNGAARFLEIAVKPNGGGSFTTLAPRQPITSTPYAIKTTNLTFNGAYNDGTIIFTASNTFTGDGAGLNTNPDPALNGINGKFNSFYGAGAGKANTTGDNNSFFGTFAGISNTTGFLNAFFGRSAGVNNTTGSSNAFFGREAGRNNITGSDNSFFGREAGRNNTASSNSFFGTSAGFNNTTGFNNTFIGIAADFNVLTPTGNNNTLLGALSRVTSGISNATAIGYQAQVSASNALVLGGINGINGATADTNVGIGTITPQARLHVNGNGLISGNFNISGNGTANILNATTQFNLDGARVLSAEGSNNLFAGINAGTTTTGSNNAFFGTFAGLNNTTGGSNAFLGVSAGSTNTTGSHNTLIGDSADVASGNLTYATAIGADAVASLSNSIYLGRASGADAVRIPGAVLIDGSLVVHTLGSAGSATVCLNAADRLAPCSSSRRYKANIVPFRSGLELINQLRPVSFTWKDSGRLDLGLVAEEVAKIEPLLTTTNANGEVEGVKYDRIAVVLLNAVKEQQTQIEEQRGQLRDREHQTMLQQQQLQQQQQEIAVLKQWYCRTHPKVTMCQPAKPTKR